MSSESAVAPSVSPAFASVAAIASAALSAQSAEDVGSALADGLLAALGCAQVHIQRIAPDGSVGQGFVRYADERPDEVVIQGLDIPSGVTAVVASGEALNVGAASDPVMRQDHVVQWEIGSALFLPVVWEGDVDTVAVAIDPAPGRFDDSDCETAMVLAHTAAGGLARLALAGRLERQVDRHAAIARAARSLNASLDLPAVLEILCEQADLAVDGDFTGVYFPDPDGRGGAIAVAGHATPSDWRGMRLEPGQGAGGRVLATGAPVILSDYRNLPDAPNTPTLVRTRTACGVPMRWDGELRGALSIGWHAPRRVTKTDMEILEAIAELAAVACRNAEAYARVQHAARTDSLTGVLNHGAMQLRLGEEIARARRDGTTLSCLLLDLDDFKHLNDRAGHLVGDQVLRAVARTLAEDFRRYDQIARYGGDEFVVILPGIEDEEALRIGDRVRAAIERAAGEVLAGSLESSVGVARWREPWTAAELLEQADRALLVAKRRGKHRVVLASAETDLDFDGGVADSDLMRAFWDMVAGAEGPRAALVGLPTLVRRVLAVAEVALYEVTDERGEQLARVATDPPLAGAPAAFDALSLRLAPEAWDRLDAGPVSRTSLSALWRAVGADGEPGVATPAGSFAAVGLVRAGRPLGLLTLRATDPEFPLERLGQARTLAGQAVIVLQGQSGEGSAAAVRALAAALDARDDDTHTASAEVVQLACDVARALGLSGGEVERVRHGALLHDVGKVGIPNEILLKRGPLVGQEWDEMRAHPEIGERILLRVPELAEIAPMVRHEHERWDGAGYPDGLEGDAIPIGSRIIFACDAFNAMITRRPYRDPMPEAEAVTELRRCAGGQFDPMVVEALVRVRADRVGAYGVETIVAE